ncbi:MAG: hypothetical protein [Cressdnaviricota sp.]|nr:MAG: hypothetical protein [Cressdnaviricota sp.]
MSLSLIPNKCARIITPISSIRFSLTAHKIRAAAVVACAVSISGVGVINFTSPSSIRDGNLELFRVAIRFQESNRLDYRLKITDQYAIDRKVRPSRRD